MGGINIGANFNYQGATFLDSRQGLPQTLDDLLNWDILVPLGFEVCVNGEWYIYKGEDYWNMETGHWEKRITLKDYTLEINKLMAEVFPATLNVSGGGVYEIGESIIPRISWELKKESALMIPEQVTIDDMVVERPESGVWRPSQPITSNRRYTVKAWYDGATYVDFVDIKFSYKKYWGVISDPAEFNDPYGLFSTWADSWRLPTTTFNCSGGFYPVYVIPLSLYPGELDFQLWVGGLRSTDFTITQKTLTNASGNTSEYLVCSLGHIQTGVLNIMFDN